MTQTEEIRLAVLAQPGWPSPIITSDWTLYPIDDGLVVINRETSAGFRLDAETVCAIAGLADPLRRVAA